jgi:hypothetical protein
MKYLCLAYGSEKDWNKLTSSEQDTLLAQDGDHGDQRGLHKGMREPDLNGAETRMADAPPEGISPARC